MSDIARVDAVVLAGGLGGTLATGRTISYIGQSDEKRRMCNLYLSLINRMGIQAKRFGDADTPLETL